jgi:hypothetical protein
MPAPLNLFCFYLTGGICGLETTARTRETASGQNRGGKAHPANEESSSLWGPCTDSSNIPAYIDACCTIAMTLITDFGLEPKSVKVQGLASDLMVEFTENGSKPKSVKQPLVWNATDCRKGLWAEIGKRRSSTNRPRTIGVCRARCGTT